MKIYIDRETTGNLYTIIGDDLWAHPLDAKNQVINFDVEADMEWTVVDGYGDPVEWEGQELPQVQFQHIIRTKLA